MWSKTVRRHGAWIVLCCFMMTSAARVLLAADAPTTKPVDFYGRVIGPDQKPVAGASVMLTQLQPAQNTRTVVATVTTDADGRFAFTGADPSTGQCIVQAKGLGLGGGVLLEGSKDDPNEIQLARPTELHLRFVDPGGNPVAGMRVWPNYLRDPTVVGVSPTIARDQFAQTTDAAGECVFPGMPQGYYFYLEIGDDRFARATDAAIRLGSKAKTEIDPIHLELGGSIEGRATYADTGKPVAGMSINAQGQQGDRYISSVSVPTDADGKYKLKQLAAGDYELRADAPAEVSAHYATTVINGFALGAGEAVTGKDLTLISGAVVQGKVTAAGGGPVAGVTVRAYNLPTTSGTIRAQSLATTGDDGSYLMHVIPGRHTVQVGAPLPPAYIASRGGSQPVTVEDKQSVSVNLEIQPNPTPPLSGRIVDADGKPIVGATINIQIPAQTVTTAAGRAGRRGGGSATIRSGPGGRFTQPNIPAEALLRARKGQAGTPTAVVVNDANRTDLTVTVQKDAMSSAAIHVLDDAGKPIPDADVSLIQRFGNTGLTAQAGATDETGTLMAMSLYPDSTYTYSVQAKGFGISSGTLSLQAGKKSDSQIKLTKADSFVGGMVLDENQLPMPNVDVYVGGGRSPSQTVKTDITGHFKATGIVAGDTVYVYPRVSTRGAGPEQQAKAGTEDLILIYTPPTPTTGPALRLGF